MFRALRSHPAATAIGVALVAVLAWLAFGYFGVHLLFLDEEVSEAAPVFDAAPPESTVAPIPEPLTPAPEAPPVSAPGDGPNPNPTPNPTPAPPPATAEVPQIITERSAEFGSLAHGTRGRAIVLGNGTGQRFLRFEEFETDNGPDLNVYLVNSATGDVSDYIDLGDLKGNIGDQNYELPAGVDLDVYDRVVIWCVRFSVAFGDATLTPMA